MYTDIHFHYSTRGQILPAEMMIFLVVKNLPLCYVSYVIRNAFTLVLYF